MLEGVDGWVRWGGCLHWEKEPGEGGFIATEECQRRVSLSDTDCGWGTFV